MENDFIMNDELLEKLNRFTRRKVTADEVYTFPVVLCDNEIDRDGERFSDEALDEMCKLFVGKTGIFDHDPKGEKQTARIFDCEVAEDKDRLTSAGKSFRCLRAKAYMMRTESNKDLIREIEGGIKKEVSVSCAVSRKICSVCGSDRRENPCGHIKGRSYDGEICCDVLDGVTDAYEWSFVAVPAQPNAGVTKQLSQQGSDSEIRKLEAELARAKETEEQACEMLRREIISLSFLTQTMLAVEAVKELTESLGFGELLKMKERLKKYLPERAGPKQQKKQDTESYKL